MKTEGFALRGEFLGPFPGGPVCRPYGMVWGGASGRPRPTWDGISGTGGSGTRPYGESGNGPFFFVGAGHWPARRRATAIPEPTLIRLAYARDLLPGREKAFGRLIAAPTADTEAVSSSRRGRSQTGPRAATWGRPYSSQNFFRVWVGEALGPPAVNGPGTVCSANPGAGMEPQNLEFLLTQGPVGREERRKVTQILRAGTIAEPDRYASPVIGVRGKATMSTKCSSEPSPAAFWLLCRRGQSNPPSADGGIFCGKRLQKGKLLAPKLRK